MALLSLILRVTELLHHAAWLGWLLGQLAQWYSDRLHLSEAPPSYATCCSLGQLHGTDADVNGTACLETCMLAHLEVTHCSPRQPRARGVPHGVREGAGVLPVKPSMLTGFREGLIVGSCWAKCAMSLCREGGACTGGRGHQHQVKGQSPM